MIAAFAGREEPTCKLLLIETKRITNIYVSYNELDIICRSRYILNEKKNKQNVLMFY